MADDDYDIDDMLNELDADEQVAAAATEAEEKADAEDAKPPKKSRVEERVDALERKYEQDALQTAINRFKEHADDVEMEIFEAARKDAPLKTIADFESAADIAKRRAASLHEVEEKLEKEAEEKVAKAWSTGPLGKSSAPDHDKEMMEAVESGDMRAAFASIVGDDTPF
jgi:hypothetical protein